MRLHRHDEIVEAMADAIYQEGFADNSDPKKLANAALDALLAAVVEKGVGGLVPVVKSINPERYGQNLVIQLEAAMTTHDEAQDWATKIAKKFYDEWSDGCCDHPYEVDFDALTTALRDARNKALDEVVVKKDVADTAAAHLAGKIEGMEEAIKIVSEVEYEWASNYEHTNLGYAGDSTPSPSDTIRAKITELKAST